MKEGKHLQIEQKLINALNHLLLKKTRMKKKKVELKKICHFKIDKLDAVKEGERRKTASN